MFNAADGRTLCGENLDGLVGIGATFAELVVVLTEFSCEVVLDASDELESLLFRFVGGGDVFLSSLSKCLAYRSLCLFSAISCASTDPATSSSRKNGLLP